MSTTLAEPDSDAAEAIRASRRTCSRCIMDTTDPDIDFDAEGVCSHCHRYDRIARQRLIPPHERGARLQALVAEGSCRVEKQGRQVRYRVEDTTFTMSGLRT